MISESSNKCRKLREPGNASSKDLKSRLRDRAAAAGPAAVHATEFACRSPRLSSFQGTYVVITITISKLDLGMGSNLHSRKQPSMILHNHTVSLILTCEPCIRYGFEFNFLVASKRILAYSCRQKSAYSNGTASAETLE